MVPDLSETCYPDWDDRRMLNVEQIFEILQNVPQHLQCSGLTDSSLLFFDPVYHDCLGSIDEEQRAIEWFLQDGYRTTDPETGVTYVFDKPGHGWKVVTSKAG